MRRPTLGRIGCGRWRRCGGGDESYCFLLLLLLLLLISVLIHFVARAFPFTVVASMQNAFWFDHEKLKVYKASITFAAWATSLLEGISKCGDVKDQLDRASTSIPLNIAEGNGKYTIKDRCRFFDIARGSALECAAALDLLVAKGKLSEEQSELGIEQLQHIVRMLIGLMKRDPTRGFIRNQESPSTND